MPDNKKEQDIEPINSSNKTKICPYCAEEIKFDAIKCRYCQSDLIGNNSIEGVTQNKEVNKKGFGCGIFVLIIVVILLLFVICTGLQGASEMRDSYRSNSSSSTIPIYSITRKTGFYSSLDSEDYSETLSAGTKIKPANNATSLDCRTRDVQGISITSCHIEILGSGRTGWVLENAIDN